MTASSRTQLAAREAPSLVGLCVGVACVVATCFLVCFAELVVGKIQIGFLQLPPVVVGMLVAILGAQAVLRRLSDRLRLAPADLAVIWVMMVLASMVSSRGLLEKLIPLLVVPNYDATPENNWKGLFFRHIRSWAVPWDPAGEPKQKVAARFFDSLMPGETIPWRMWAVPLAAWGIFAAAVVLAFLCLAVLLRRQWADNEKLAFPLVQLPVEMARAGQGVTFLQNRITWVGFAIPAAVFGFNGLHQWYPSVPELQTDLNINLLLTQPPWSFVGFFHAFVSFAAIGFFYLLPTDLLFSLWLFFLLTILADGISASYGYQPEVMPMYGCRMYIGYQIIGCYFVMVGFMLWSARPHLAAVWRAAVGRVGRDRPDAGEMLSYRSAVWTLLVCFTVATGWLCLLGMAWWMAAFQLAVLLLVVAVVMARSSCESGMLMTETSFRPIDVYRMLGDVRQLGGSNITALAFLDAMWMRDQRGLMLTGFLDSMKLADGMRMRRRSLLLPIVLALVVAVGVAGYLHISLPYKLGAAQQMYTYVYRGNPVWSFNDAAVVLNGTRPPLPMLAKLNFLVGVVVTLAIASLRARLLWFPIHPLGYALCGTWTMMVFWFPCLVAWMAKIVILRYGGMKLYTRARPLFLGMVLGEFTMALVWTVPSLFWRTPTPAFPWP